MSRLEAGQQVILSGIDPAYSLVESQGVNRLKEAKFPSALTIMRLSEHGALRDRDDEVV